MVILLGESGEDEDDGAPAGAENRASGSPST